MPQPIPSDLAQIIDVHRHLFGGFQMKDDDNTQGGNSAGTTPAGSSTDGNAGATSTGNQQGTPRTFTQEELDALIDQRLKRERAKFGDYDDLKTKAGEYDKLKDAQKTELEREKEARERAERERDTERVNNLRLKVATAKGVPENLLSGSTKDELEASADVALDWLKEQSGRSGTTPPVAQTAGQHAPGAGSTQERADAAAKAGDVQEQIRLSAARLIELRNATPTRQ